MSETITYTITYTQDDIEIIRMQEAIAGCGDRGPVCDVLIRTLDYVMRLMQENCDLRERVAAIEARLAEREGEL